MIEQVAIASINHILSSERWAAKRLAPFAGREARLSMPPMVLTFRIGRDGLLEPSIGIPPSVEITLSSTAPLRLFGGADALMSDAHISGSADFADALGFVLRNLQWDVAEDLSRIFGDILAQRMVYVGKALQAWSKQATRNVQENLHEYVAYEQDVLLNRRTFTSFADSIRELSSVLDRLEQRVVLLEQ